MFQLIFRFILLCKGPPEKLFMRFNFHSFALHFALKLAVLNRVDTNTKLFRKLL